MVFIVLNFFCYNGFYSISVCHWVHAKCCALSCKSQWKRQQTLRKGQAGKIRYGIRERCDQTNHTEYCIFILVLNSIACGGNWKDFFLFIFFYYLLKIHIERTISKTKYQTRNNPKPGNFRIQYMKWRMFLNLQLVI